jgi:hypothetical protein
MAHILCTHVRKWKNDVEAIPGIGEEGMKENDGGVNSRVIYLLY